MHTRIQQLELIGAYIVIVDATPAFSRLIGVQGIIIQQTQNTCSIALRTELPKYTRSVNRKQKRKEEHDVIDESDPTVEHGDEDREWNNNDDDDDNNDNNNNSNTDNNSNSKKMKGKKSVSKLSPTIVRFIKDEVTFAAYLLPSDLNTNIRTSAKSKVGANALNCSDTISFAGSMKVVMITGKKCSSSSL